MRLNQSQLKSVLNYDPKTGLFSWADGRLNKVGCITRPYAGKEYRRIMVRGKIYYGHRLAWLYIHGRWPNCVDHINGNGLDNRICNLRNVTKQVNNRNKKFNATLLPGVLWEARAAKKWRATIGVNGKTIELGYFDDLLDAAATRKSAEIRYQYHKNHGS